MSEISINWQNANFVLDTYSGHKQEIANAISSIRSIKSYRCIQGRKFESIYRALGKAIDSLENEKTSVENLENGLRNVLRTYDTYENKIVGSGETASSFNILDWLKELEINPALLFGLANPMLLPSLIGLEISKNMSKEEWISLGITLLSKAGIVGAGAAAVGNLATGNWSEKSIISAGKNLMAGTGGILGEVSKTLTGGDAKWKDALFGLKDVLGGLDDTSTAGEAFKSSFIKQGKDLIFKDGGTWADKGKVITKWGGYALSFFSNYLDNVEEFKGQEGMEARMAGEIVVETVVDIGVGALATAGVTAGAAALVSAGVIASAPAVAVGAVAAGATFAANKACKWAFGKDIGELAADTLCDLAEGVANGLGAVANWGKSLLGFA